MKKLATSSLALALWMNGSAEAQSPFFQPASQPIQPAAAFAPAPAPLPPGGVVPVRVHFGGALTRDGIVPVPFYLNQSSGPALQPTSAGVSRVQMTAPSQAPASQDLRIISTQGESKEPKKENVVERVFVTPEESAPSIGDPRFVAPDVGDMYRPRPAPLGYRWYSGFEYLHYWTKLQESPNLLESDTFAVSAKDVDSRTRQGGRITFGHWLTTTREPWAIEGVFSFTARKRASVANASNGSTTLVHPFIDAANDVPDQFPVAIDPLALDPRSGRSEISVSHEMFNFEANLRRELRRSSHGHIDLLFGYRQFHLDESLSIRDKIIYDTAPVPLSDATVHSLDYFGTHNRMFAGQIGIDGEFNWHGLFVGAWGKFALGCNQEVININGFTQVRDTPRRLPPTDLVNGKNYPGSLYALPSNIGRYTENQFTVMPEVGVNFGYAITSNVRLAAGYNFFFINNVVRPGDAIDATIDRNQVPQLQPFVVDVGNRPAPPNFVETSYWAHGITVQMEFRY